MLKKIISLILFLTVFIISISSFQAQHVSAFDISVSSQTQTLTNGVSTASWDVGWQGGQSSYTLAFRSDADQGYRTMIAHTNHTGHDISQKYDLGAATSKTWKPVFRVIDYWGLTVSEEVEVKHNRFDQEDFYDEFSPPYLY